MKMLRFHNVHDVERWLFTPLFEDAVHKKVNLEACDPGILADLNWGELCWDRSFENFVK